jgi:D-3-phosphoglycerate dehydrogenase
MATILINDSIDQHLIEILSLNHQVISRHHTYDDLKIMIQSIDCIIIKSKTKIDSTLIDHALETKKLKLVIRAGVGIDNIDSHYAKSHGIDILNTPNASTHAVAELTLAYILLMSRPILEANTSMHEMKWEKDRFMGSELRHKTLGIVGLGRIGLRVASLATAFGMNVIYHDTYVNNDIYEKKDFDSLIKLSDYITFHTPSSEKPLLDLTHLGMLKKGVSIINVSRGSLISDDFIIEGIQNKIIKCIALDVYTNEPNVNQKFSLYNNIYMTPHIGASTLEAQESISDEIISIIKDYFK